ncbi:TRAP transporter small permease [Roseinatronobacter alkalisoli]|uniref:TRAP transporter small permease protein n=1 Tax=Roseinatronobacter alkalisoli TaxID=3028235 RepID=A0ABT5TEF6_9RHOB|nr:TRAP transporter small permease subunit [Roseinatronobacter sp. HJB301]MDD7973497.1 TRAP transporter small permease subunit [Roseinatronobacter sp. HJB301]
MRPLVVAARGLSHALDYSGRVIAVACMAVMFAALLLNVILRYVFGTGLPMAYEIHAVLLPWLVSGGLVIAAAHNRNIAITLLPDLLPLSARRWLFVAVQCIILAIAVSVLWTSQPILRASTFQTLSTLGLKQIWGYSSLVYAFAGMGVIAVCDLLRLLVRDPAILSGDTVASFS